MWGLFFVIITPYVFILDTDSAVRFWFETRLSVVSKGTTVAVFIIRGKQLIEILYIKRVSSKISQNFAYLRGLSMLKSRIEQH